MSAVSDSREAAWPGERWAGAASNAAEPGTRRSLIQTLRLVRRAVKFTLAAILGAACLGYGFLFALHLAPLVMVTGSMGATIPAGSLVVDKAVPPSELRVGDVITFQKPIGEHGLDTHRIVGIDRSGPVARYQTKGDENGEPDPWMISFPLRQKANRVVFHVPYLGWALLYLRMPLVRTLVLVVAMLTLLTTFLKALGAYGASSAQEEPKSDVDERSTVEATPIEVVPAELVSVEPEPSTALVVRQPGASELAVRQPNELARVRPVLAAALALAAFAIVFALRSR